jgi:hypothetical protein
MRPRPSHRRLIWFKFFFAEAKYNQHSWNYKTCTINPHNIQYIHIHIRIQIQHINSHQHANPYTIKIFIETLTSTSKFKHSQIHRNIDIKSIHTQHHIVLGPNSTHSHIDAYNKGSPSFEPPPELLKRLLMNSFFGSSKAACEGYA